MTTHVATPPIHDILVTVVPMLADTDAINIASLQGTHLFDTKLDGVRAIAAWDGHRLTMRNRNNRQMDNYLDLEVSATDIPAGVIVDGEIISSDGKFQTAAYRDKQRGGANEAAALKSHPAYFVAFDILWHPEHGDVRHLPYIERRVLLEGLNLGVVGGGRWSTSVASSDPKFYDVIRATGGEGVVAKHLQARYEPGRRKHWLKFKSCFSVTALVTGYEPGKGSRAELGAIYLSLLTSASTSLAIGKAGSGFTLPESLEMKAILDKAMSAQDLPVVEIKCLGVTTDGKLRQPVFIGYRTDLTIADCVASQLDSLPRG